MVRLATALILTLILSTANAAEMFQFGETPRSYGMGGVRVGGSPHDASAFLWNPANLTYQKGMNWDFFSIGIGSNAYDKYERFQGFEFHGLESLDELYGEFVQTDFQGVSAFTLPFFGVAVYDQGYLSAIAHNPAFPVLDMTFLHDYALAVGASIPLGPEGSFGVNFKRITRRGGPLQLGASVLDNLDNNTILDQFENEGIGYGIDAGLMMRADGPFHPTVSLAWQDIGSTSFVKTKGTAPPERIKDNLTLGLAFEQEIPLAGIAGGIEYRHITDTDEQLGKKIHMGLEVSLANIDLRAGFYQGYPTYGAAIDLWLLEVNAAMYTVERGAYPGQTPDKRVQIGIGMNFSFDPDFKITDESGRKRRFKQRR
ncbi:MAG: hypothetical protein KF681_06775 [Bdellovibrionaceae bacterium]|nr:hypothetical protein [Pseudobdellovibrionaceae bacterium]